MPATPPSSSGRRAWSLTDLDDYSAIGNGVLNVRDGCLSTFDDDDDDDDDSGKGEGYGREKGRRRLGFANPAGYDTAGLLGAIGVFLWDSDSLINQAVKEVVGFGVAGGNVTGGREGVVEIL